jgi:MFS family permease
VNAGAPALTRADRLLGGRLWRHRDFVKLWIGQGISEAGSQVTFLALPTAAILLLHAGPFEVGLLGALEFLPFPTLGLIAGVYADRIRRRPIMIVCDVGRAMLLASIPIAWLLGSLTMPQLYAVSLLMGIGTVFFDVSYQSYLPALIERRDLVEGNSKLEVSRSAAALTGPAIAGFLIQLVGAAQAMWADAASFVVSVATLLGIRKPEPPPAPGTEAGRTGFFHEMWEGIGVVFGNPTLWKIAGCTATSNLGSNMIFAVFLIFVYRQLHLSPGVVGVVFAIAAVGGLTGALTAGTIARRVGLGLTLLLAIAVGGGVWALIPLARYGAAVPLLLISGFVAFFTEPLYNINQVSLRQAITPDRVQGRMNATMRTIVWGTNPIGSFLGGVLGSVLGVVPTLWIGIVIATLAAGWIIAGPVRLREQPSAVS